MLPLDDSMEDVMGDDEEKSIVEKTIETVKEMATSVTDAAKHAMEPEPLKPEKGVVTMPPPMDAGSMTDPVMPPFVLIPRQKKTASKKAVKRTAKNSAAPINSTKRKSAAKKT